MGKSPANCEGLNTMKIIIAPDSFKESLSAPDAAEAIAKGVKDACCDAETVIVPMADGGEGTVEAVVAATGGRFRTVSVSDPLGRTIEAVYGLLEDNTAIIEMAAASGLDLLSQDERNPMRTSTRGTGALIRNALDEGVSRIIVGVGGSATVDCGAGMASRLGVEFLDSSGERIDNPGGAELERIEGISTEKLDRRVGETEFTVACDVTNPLVGPEGAARVYAPQKGADSAMTARLEKAIEHFADVVRRDLGVDIATLPGAGAAGGLAAGLVAFTGARIRSGIETVIEAVDLESKLKDCRLVITGEGKADYQSAFGKTPAGVGELAERYAIPVIVLAGKLSEGYRELYRHGITAAFSISDGPMDTDEAFRATPRLLRQTAESAVRLHIKKNSMKNPE